MMKEGADVYRVRDNQRGATLIIVIKALGLKRRVTRMRRAACAPHRARSCKLRTRRSSKRPNASARARACECNACIRTHVRAHSTRMHAREMQRTIRAVAYESICAWIMRGARTARHGRMLECRLSTWDTSAKEIFWTVKEINRQDHAYICFYN